MSEETTAPSVFDLLNNPTAMIEGSVIYGVKQSLQYSRRICSCVRGVYDNSLGVHCLYP
jgi:hypothetical protein